MVKCAAPTQLTHIEASSRRTQTCSTEAHSVPHILHRALHPLHAPHTDHYGLSARRSEHRTARRFRAHATTTANTSRRVDYRLTLLAASSALRRINKTMRNMRRTLATACSHFDVCAPLRLCRNRLTKLPSGSDKKSAPKNRLRPPHRAEHIVDPFVRHNVFASIVANVARMATTAFATHYYAVALGPQPIGWSVTSRHLWWRPLSKDSCACVCR